jgi:hypothetical protein|tara:strand:- start:47 stop:253 length:207 start_codon:yes stop_codon:yes gene_type:complete
MNTTGRIIVDATNHMNYLVSKHQKLHKEVEESIHTTDDLELKKLKVEKLRLKDDIERLKTSLQKLAEQ